MKPFIALAALLFFSAALFAACPLSGTVPVNFDSVTLPSGTFLDATTYLNTYGMTFTPLTSGVTAQIASPGATAATASSQPNLFVVNTPGNATMAVSYQLGCCAPLSSVSFTRTAISGQNVGDAAWTASALNAQNQVIATTSESFLIAPTAQRYTLTASGITALRIDARNDIARTTFNDPPLDDLTLVASTAQTITSLVPSSVAAGSSTFTMTVNGSGFGSDAIVLWNGSALPTTFVGSTQVNATVSSTLVASAGTATVTVFTGGTTSNAVTFTIGSSSLSITSLSPSSTAPGGGTFTLTVNGTGFASNAVVLWNGSALPTTFVGSTQLTATVSSNLILSAGNATITVLSGGITSNALTFTISASGLSISSLSPASAAPGGPTFTLTVDGSGFASNAAVLWNGVTLPTTFVSANELTATVSSLLILSSGTASVTVLSGGVTSNALTFTIGQGGLAITSLSPPSVTPGGPTFTLTVNGSGFVNGAAVLWNGSTLPTTFVNSTQLTATVGANLLLSPASVSITVLSGGQTSNALTFTIGTPTLTLTSLNPSSAAAGGAAFTLTVNGTGFAAGAAVLWNSTALPTTLVNSGQLTATVSGALIASAGSASVTVSSGGTNSNALTFTITQGGSGCPLNGTTTLNFDSLVLAQFPATPTNATAYLNSNGVTFTPISSGLFPIIYNATPSGSGANQSPAIPNSSPNVFNVATTNPGLTNFAYSYQLNFCAPLTSVSFVRAGFVSTAGDAAWNASALNSQGQTVASTGEAFLTGAAAQRYSLNAAGIVALRIDARNDIAQTTFPTPPLDDLTLVAGSGLTISSLSPSSAIAGASGFTMTVNGSGFVSGAAVQWNGSNLLTTFINSSQLTAAVPTGLILIGGNFSITVVNPNGATSNSVSFLVATAGFAITSLNPNTAAVGGPAFTLTVNGSGFLSGASVQWNNTFLLTTFVNSTQLLASVPASLIASTGSASIIVVNPGGAVSSSASFTITTGGPAISSLTPASALAGGPAFTLTVNGSGFTSGASVEWNSSFLPTTFVNSSQLTAVVPAGLIAAAGSANVVVLSTSGTTSNTVTFAILNSTLSQFGGFAHIAAGAGWNTSVTMVNLSGTAVPIRLRFWDNNGAALPLIIAPGAATPNQTNIQAGTTFDETIPGNGTVIFDLNSGSSVVQVGWVEVLAPQGSTLSGFAVFQFLNPNQNINSQGTSPLTTSTSTTLIVPYDNTTFVSGMALANQSGTLPASLAITVFDANGTVIANDSLPLAPDGHVSFLVVDRYPGAAGKRGTIQITNVSQGVLTGLAFRFDGTQAFTSVPVTFR